ncbi:MAG TPA: class I SAM-dependent methyltransferase [Xanthobacteraceae bacterium]|nr:class I SAM-dependent methyltransferase [Xanthobacteraceae bacterium]
MPCQICGGAARTVLLKEQNVSCGDYFEGRRLYEQDLGEIALVECTQCGFGYFPELQSWPEAKFRTDIYNADYHLCDPPFLDERPRKLAAWLGSNLKPCDLIDFGGGEGKMADLLAANGFRARSYDPFYGDPTFPTGDADVVTAFEVVEHVPDQSGLFGALASLRRRGGLLVFSTSLKTKTIAGDWWYTSARNGHVSFHTADSLKRTLDKFGLTGVSLSNQIHVAAPTAAALTEAVHWPAVAVSDTPGFVFRDGWRRMVPARTE